MIMQDITYDAAVKLLTVALIDCKLKKRIKSGKTPTFMKRDHICLVMNIHAIKRTMERDYDSANNYF